MDFDKINTSDYWNRPFKKMDLEDKIIKILIFLFTIVTKHLRNIFQEGELEEDSVCANFARTAADN